MQQQPEFIEFESSLHLADALAERVSAILDDAVAKKGHGSLAVSGGSTPVKFFQALSKQSIAWDKITITLVDERWVPTDSERSNARLVVINLLQDKAASANFIPLFVDGSDLESGLILKEAELSEQALPLDCIILGMGTDGHTASFFPGGNNLAAATAKDQTRALVSIEAPGAGEPRATLTLPIIAQCANVILHIEGANKKTVYEAALAGNTQADSHTTDELPVRHVINAVENLQVYWANLQAD